MISAQIKHLEGQSKLIVDGGLTRGNEKDLIILLHTAILNYSHPMIDLSGVENISPTCLHILTQFFFHMLESGKNVHLKTERSQISLSGCVVQ